MGKEVEIPYSVTMTATNGQTYCTITVEDPNGETTQLASSDRVYSGYHMTPSFTPDTEGTYTITAVVGSYIDFVAGISGVPLSRYRIPSITDVIHIQAVRTLPAAPEPEESPAPADPGTPAAPSDPKKADNSTAPTKTDDTTAPTKTSDSTKPATAASVKDKVTKLPAVSKLTTADETTVEKAYQAYEALSKEEKAKLPSDTLSKLNNAREKIKSILKAESADKNSVKNREARIISHKSDKDPKKSTYAPLRLKASETTKSSITVKWSKVKGAAGYIVYGNTSGKSSKLKLLGTTTKTKLKVKKIGNKKLKKGKNYKFLVLAYKMKNGYKKVAAASKMIHACTTGGSYTNVKQVKPKETKKTLKKGRSWTIKTSTTKKDSKKSIKKVLGLRYESSNKAVASVSSKGKVTAKKSGKATIYVYAQNGACASVAVTVKAK